MSETIENKNQFSLDTLNVSNLPELKGFEQTQKSLVKENPFVEIIDNKTYETACKSRTALLKGRTALEGQEKLIVSKITAFRKQVGEKTKELIDITLPFEEKQQTEVKRWEQIKENERIAKAEAEQKRIDAIKAKIEVVESDSYALIQKTTFEQLKSTTEAVKELLQTDFDFQEYDILFEQTKERVVKSLLDKTNDLTERENQRLENEELKKANEEAERKAKELQDKLDAEQKDREAKEEEMKDKVFEIRKTRLLEIGMLFSDEHSDDSFYTKENPDYIVLAADVYNMDVIAFEDLISECKGVISTAKEQKEAETKQREATEKAEKEARAKSEKENKERQKRLATDKKIIAESLETYFADLHLDSDNKESNAFIESANIKIQSLKNQLLTELNEL